MTILASHITCNSKEGCPVQSKFSPEIVISYQQYTIKQLIGCRMYNFGKIDDLPQNLQIKQAYKMFQYAKKLQKH